MPEFSGLAFVSKIMMFIDPTSYVTLDKKIMMLSDLDNDYNPLTKIVFGVKETTIWINKKSEEQYQKWCELCNLIAGNTLLIK